MIFTSEAIEQLTCTTILQDDVVLSLMEITDPVRYERTLQELERRAMELRVKTEFKRLVKSFEKGKGTRKKRSRVQTHQARHGAIALKKRR